MNREELTLTINKTTHYPLEVEITNTLNLGIRIRDINGNEKGFRVEERYEYNDKNDYDLSLYIQLVE